MRFGRSDIRNEEKEREAIIALRRLQEGYFNQSQTKFLKKYREATGQLRELGVERFKR